MRDTKSLLLLLLSLGLVTTWVYHLYDKNQYSKKAAVVSARDSANTTEAIRDSLRKAYTATLNNFDSRLDSTRNNVDSLKGRLDTKLGEVDELKNEIGLLKGKNGITRRMPKDKSPGTDISNIKEPQNEPADFTASDLRLSAIAESDNKEQEISAADKTDKLVASFAMQNKAAQSNSTDVYVVIVQPNGQVLQSSWESGIFESGGERKIYSAKMHVESAKEETRHFRIPISSDTYQQGNYMMQLFQNGQMIGQTTRKLQ